jgi:hypothetical protein
MNIRIGNRVVNIDNVTYIIDRQVYFNNGTSWVATEPEIQDLLAAMFNEPRKQDDKVVRNDTVPVRNRTNKSKRVSA